MPEGDRHVTLLEPDVATETTALTSGQVIPGPPIEHEWWATRRDRGGGEGLDDDAQIGRWTRTYRGRQWPSNAGLTNSWSLRDADGITWDIETVGEEGPPGAARLWRVQCIRRT